MLVVAAWLPGVAVAPASATSVVKVAAPATTAELHPGGARAPLSTVVPRIFAASVLPASVDLRKYAVPVGDQGHVNSCVAWAIDYGMLGWYSRRQGRPGQPFAPMYAYVQINHGVDNGSWPLDALKLAVKRGNDTKADYSQGNFDFSTPPTADEHAAALHYRIKPFHTLFSRAGQAGASGEIKHALAAGHPVVVSFPIRPGFDNLGHTAAAVDNDISGRSRGGHAALALAYDAAGLILQNSWGTAWANKGYGRVSWRVVGHDVMEADTIDGFAADTLAPTIKTPTATAKSTGASTTNIVHTARYLATSSNGIVRYMAYKQTNGGPLTAVTLPTATTTTFATNAASGSLYRIAIKAEDRAGRWSALRYSAPFSPSLVQEDDPLITYSGDWSAADSAGASGGHVMTTRADFASATITADMSGISWVSTRGLGQALGEVLVPGGGAPIYVNTQASTTQAGVVVSSVTFPTAGLHTLIIVRPQQLFSFNAALDLDAFVITTPTAPIVVPPTAPSAPAIAAATPRLDGADVSFTIADTGGSAITATEAVTVPPTQTFEFLGTDRTVRLSGLDPAIAYEVRVRATNLAGASAWSDPAGFTPSDHRTLIGTPVGVVDSLQYNSEGGPSGNAQFVLEQDLWGQLERRDLTTGATTVVSVLPDGTPSAANFSDGGGSARRPRRHMSTDGRYVMFWATSDGETFALYLRDTLGGTTTVIDPTVLRANSTFAAELSGDGQTVVFIKVDDSYNSTLWRWHAGTATQLPTPAGVNWSTCNPTDFSLSNDGTRVAFDAVYCATDAGAGLNTQDVYVYDVAAGVWQATAQFAPPGPDGTQTEYMAAPSLAGNGTAALVQVSNADQGYPAAPEQLELYSLLPGQSTLGIVVPGSTQAVGPDPSAPAVDARYWLSADGSVAAWGWTPCADGVISVNIWDRGGAGATMTVTEPCQAGDALVDVRLSDDGSALFFTIVSSWEGTTYEQALG